MHQPQSISNVLAPVVLSTIENTCEFRQANPNGLGNNSVVDNKKPGVDEIGLHKNAKWLGFLLSNNLAGSKCRGKKT